MNTPPEPPKFDLLSPDQPGIDLAKLATMFAVGIGICFGLCAVSVLSGADSAVYFAGFFAIVQAICWVGLLTIAVIAIFRGIRNHFRS